MINPVPSPPAAALHKLLGPLEAAIMELMWDRQQHATVWDMVGALCPTHPCAYVTVMTVMVRLVAKGLLYRQPSARPPYRYTAALGREEYLNAVLAQLVDQLVTDFGERALARMHQHLTEAAAPDAPTAEGVAA